MIKIALTLFLLLQITFSYAETEHERYTPPGTYVNFDVYSLFYHCEGEREPTVIIEGGLGYSLAEWLPIQQALSTHLRTCVYDRAGYGMSYPGKGARTAAQIAEELYDLLKVADIPGPYIMIGHSFGGFIVQYFTKKNPQKISGVVLVESSHPDQIDRLTKFNLINKNENREIITGREPLYSGIPKDALSHWDMLNSRRKAFFTQMEENSYFQESAEQTKNAGKFPDVPLAVITRDQELLPVTENGHSMENEWRKMQRELVQLSKHGWQTIAKNSGHSTHIDAPNVVIEEVLKIRDKINGLSSYSGTNNN